jgi:hypothetical protein
VMSPKLVRAVVLLALTGMVLAVLGGALVR